jgi:dihydrofolate reductase
MRKLVTGAFVSLDGVIQAPGGPQEDTDGGFQFGGWTAPYWDETAAAAMQDSFSRPFALVLGRRTYDIFAGHWPKFKGEPGSFDQHIADTFNSATKYVATHSPETLTWQNSQSLGLDVAATIRELKKQDGPELLTQGRSALIQTLLTADLIDEFKLLIYPLVLGTGKRLFGSGTMPGAFKVTKSVVSPDGVVIATYQRAGEVKTGSFELPENRQSR